MKKIREVILDFTPLLDVTLIILFYFIMFSHMGAADAKEQAEQAMKDAKEATANAEQMMSDAEQMQQDAEQMLSILETADQNAAAMAEALDQFSKGDKFILNLKPSGQELMLYFKRGKEDMGYLAEKDISESSLSQRIKDAGYTADNVILCEFIYDSTDSGTNDITGKIEDALKQIRKEYKHFYWSESDLDSEE